MECDKKSRGRQHRLKKKQFQNKSKVVHKTVSKKELGNLPNNFKRLPDCDDSTDYDSAEDVNVAEDDVTNYVELNLKQVPLSIGGYFQFKSDKNVESEFDFEKFQKNKTFSLDLSVLQYSLNTIPFHERCGLEKDYFTKEEIKKMNDNADLAAVEYQSYLRCMDLLKKPAESATHSKHVSVMLCEENNSLAKTTDKSSNVEVGPFSSMHQHIQSNKDNLEEWLDDILND